MLPELAKHTEKLLYFYEIVQEGSLQATGRKLGVSAATLSYSLRELEAATGVTLLSRSKKGMVPTPSGERLFDFCQKLYKDLDQIQMLITDTKRPLKRKIKIGTFSSIAIYFWPLLQDELQEEDSLSISLSTKRSKEILELLMKKEIEIAITVGSFDHPTVVKHELYRDSFGYYTNLKSSKKIFSPVSARDEVLFYIPDAEDEDGKSLRQHVQNQGLHFKEEFELDSFDVIAEFIKKGYGIGILPLRVAQNLGPSLKKISDVEFGTHCFYLSYRRDLDIKQSDLKRIMEAAQKAVKKLQRT